jgi:hypothetical protein
MQPNTGWEATATILKTKDMNICFHVSNIYVNVVFKSVKFHETLISGLQIFSGELR